MFNRVLRRSVAALLCLILCMTAVPSTAFAAETIPPIKGDLNRDGTHNLVDAMCMYRHVSGAAPMTADQLKRADYYFDGKVNITDALHIYSYASGASKYHPGSVPIREAVTADSVYMQNLSVTNTITGNTFTAKTKEELQMAVAEVVRFEIGMSTFGKDSPEAWKAFAVAAYTLLARHCYNGSTYKIAMGSDIDLSKTTDRRIYDACGEVLGIKIAYDDPNRSAYNQLVQTFYSASSAGVTCTTLNAWGYTDLEYLKIVESPYDNDEWINTCSSGTDALTHRFSITIPELYTCLCTWLKTDTIYAEEQDGQFSLYPLKTDGPYWARSNLYYINSAGSKKYVSGVDIYTAINYYGRPHCYSHAITVVSQEDDLLTIETKGNGHGIGISQYGAAGFANEAGWSYDQILAHYYSINNNSKWGLVGPKW